jgi:hypothetical protein
MRPLYLITSIETGTILLKRRKIAKALRWWLRDNKVQFTSVFYLSSDFENRTAENRR